MLAYEREAVSNVKLARTVASLGFPISFLKAPRLKLRPNYVAHLLAGCIFAAYAGESLIHIEAKGQTVENGKALDMEFTEVERRSDASIVQVAFRSGGSVSSSLFILRGMCSVARARGENYFKSLRLPAPEGRYIVRFQRSTPGASEAAPAGEVFSLLQCERLGF